MNFNLNIERNLCENHYTGSTLRRSRSIDRAMQHMQKYSKIILCKETTDINSNIQLKCKNNYTRATFPTLRLILTASGTCRTLKIIIFWTHYLATQVLHSLKPCCSPFITSTIPCDNKFVHEGLLKITIL